MELIINHSPAFTDYYYKGTYGNLEFLICDKENEELTIDWLGNDPNEEDEIDDMIIKQFNKEH